MKIISHRGYWQDASEKNSIAAFHRSFALGFGTETDVRDCAGQLVISHDMPTGNELSFDAFLQLADNYKSPSRLTLALNIKSDGLVDPINEAVARYSGLDCFVFDMSIPDSRAYLESSLPVFMRMSEVENSLGVTWQMVSGSIVLKIFGLTAQSSQLFWMMENLSVLCHQNCMAANQIRFGVI